MLGEDGASGLVALFDEALHLFVDHLRDAFAVVAARRAEVFAEEHVVVVGPVVDGPDAVAHAELGHHAAGEVRRLLDVVGGAGREVTERDLFRHATTHQHAEARHGEGTAHREAVFLRQLLGDAEGGAARDDGDLVDRVGELLLELGDEGVTGFVPSCRLLLLVVDDHAAALGAHQHLVLGHLEVEHADHVLVLAGGQESGLVHEVLEVGADEAGCTAGDDVEVDVGRERHLLGVDAQDAFTAAHVGPIHDDAAVEATGAHDGGVEDVGAVRGGDDDDALVRLEAVHLDEELVQGLLALVVSAAEARATVATHSVDLVDEDDAGRVLFALLEEIAHAARADAHEHLDEVGAGDAEERHACLTSDGAGEQRLAGARGAHHEHALRDAAAELLELLRVLEEGDDLFELVLGLVDAGYVGEGDLVGALAEQACPRLAEAHRLAPACLQLPHEQVEHDDQEDHRKDGDERTRPER